MYNIVTYRFGNSQDTQGPIMTPILYGNKRERCLLRWEKYVIGVPNSSTYLCKEYLYVRAG